MSIITQSDPRYKRGVYTNTRGVNEQKRRDERKAFLDNHPGANGWEYTGRCRLTDLPVYVIQAGNKTLHLRRSETGRFWVVWLPDNDQRHFAEPPAIFTPRIIGELETERLQAEWEATNPPDDYGLEARA